MRAINSALAQTWSDFELIVVDDGSTDEGAEPVKRLSDPRIRVIEQANAGVSAARNRGIAEARADLIAFLDADDEWRPGFLAVVLDLAEKYPEAGIYATAYLVCDDAGCTRPQFSHCVSSLEGGLLDDYFLAALGPAPVWTSVVMVPKRVFDTVGTFPLHLTRGEDLHMWARIALAFRIAWSPSEGAIYHLASDNRACNSNELASDIAVAPIIEEFLRSGADALPSKLHAQEYLAKGRIALAKSCYLNGKRRWAAELLGKTSSTVLYTKERRTMMLMMYVPAGLPRVLLGISGLLHGR